MQVVRIIRNPKSPPTTKLEVRRGGLDVGPRPGAWHLAPDTRGADLKAAGIPLPLEGPG